VKSYRTPVVLILLSFLILGCSRKVEIPIQDSALNQFYYAMDTYYFPADKAEGSQRRNLAKKGTLAFQAVIDNFTDTIQPLVLMEAYFYQGKCWNELEEKEKAVESFWQCFSNPQISVAPKDSVGTAMLGYKDNAWQMLMELLDEAPTEYIYEIQSYEPM